MGVEFAPCGVIKPDILAELDLILNKVKLSPAKSNQKIWILKNSAFDCL